MAPKDLFIGLYGVCLVGGLGICLECVLVVVGIGLPGGGFLIVAGGSGEISMVAGSALTRDESEGRVGGGRKCQCGRGEWGQEAEEGEGRAGGCPRMGSVPGDGKNWRGTFSLGKGSRVASREKMNQLLLHSFVMSSGLLALIEF